MTCIHVREERSEDDHLTFESIHVLHFLDDNWNSPDPIGKNEKETVK